MSSLQQAGVDVSGTIVCRSLHKQKYRGFTARCKSLAAKTGWPGYSLLSEKKESTEKSLHCSEKKVLIKQIKGQIQPRLTCNSVGKREVCRPKLSAQDPKHPWSVKYGGGGVIVWACMAATCAGSLAFIDNVTADGILSRTEALLRLSKGPDADMGKCRKRCLFRQSSVTRWSEISSTKWQAVG